jgi:hypothetical protein
MANQNASSRTVLQQLLSLLFREVITPGAERGHRDTTANPEELNSRDGDARTVEDMRLRPIPAGPQQLLGRFIIAGYQNHGLVDGSKHLDANPDIPTHFAKIAGADQRVNTTSSSHQTPGGARVAM